MLYQVETAGEDPERALTKYCSLFPYQQDIVDYARLLLTGISAHREQIENSSGRRRALRIDRIAYVTRMFSGGPSR